MKLHHIRGKILCLLIVFFSLQVEGQVTIGSGVNPNSGSLLDLKENDAPGANSKRGLLFPRVELEDITKLDPCVSSSELEANDKNLHIGLLVYNVTDRPEDGLCPGIYVWEGNNWTRIPEPCIKPTDPVDPDLIYSPNSYFVSPGGVSEDIPIAKAYLVSEYRSDLANVDRNQKVFVELLWQDTQDLIDKVELVNGDEGIHSKFKVTIKNNGKKGNALVALHVGPNGDKNDPIAWSWHIWVTDYDPDNGGTTYSHNNGEKTYEFMDRSLGAITTSMTDVGSMGLMYQWGRKDPFSANTLFGDNPSFRDLYDINNTPLTEVDELQTGSSGTGIQHVEVTELKNLSNSILYPWKYYYAKRDDTDTSDNRSDWFTSDESGTNTDNDLWGGVSNKKSVFDPCPKGWKVPAMSSATKSPWARYEGFMSDNISFGANGFVLNAITAAPATGQLGFFAFHFPRIPRTVNECLVVGCTGQDYAGGVFVTTAFANSERGGLWTATAGANNLSAKASGIVGAGTPMPSLVNQDAAKSGALNVRCVKE